MKHTITYFAGNNIECIAVSVPEFATNFDVYFDGKNTYLVWKMLYSKKLCACILPNGKWIFISSTYYDFGNKMAKDIVEYDNKFYRDYQSKEPLEKSFVFKTALESFQSLFQFFNLNRPNYAILKHKK